MASISVNYSNYLATVTIENHGKLNALNIEMWHQLGKLFIDLDQNLELRCILIHGAGEHFAAGADVEEFATARNTLKDGMHYHNQVIAKTLEAIQLCRHPVVAMINGVCVGGGLEIALSADIRIATPKASFGIPIANLGFPLAPLELQNLLGLVNKSVVLEMLLEAKIFTAQEALQKSLVHRISENIEAETAATIQRICDGAPLAARSNKHMIRRLSNNPEPLSQIELEQAFSFLETQDYQEGLFCFLGKTKPQFTGQ
jgi:enoyl-CoA hydratase/carnithine racemase